MITNDEPDLRAEALKNQACVRLAEYLADCGARRGDNLWSDRFEFQTSEGEADIAGARRFAETLRAQLGGCVAATKIGVLQNNNVVRVRVIAECDVEAQDAIERPLAVAAH